VIAHLKATRGWEVSAASCGVALLYMMFWPQPKRDMRLSMRSVYGPCGAQRTQGRRALCCECNQCEDSLVLSHNDLTAHPPLPSPAHCLSLSELYQTVAKAELAPGTEYLSLEVCQCRPSGTHLANARWDGGVCLQLNVTDSEGNDIDVPPVRVKIPPFQPKA